MRSTNPGQSGTKLYIKKIIRSKASNSAYLLPVKKKDNYRNEYSRTVKFEIIKETRAKSANIYNGDAINYIESDKKISLIIVDGLGHGIYASQAANLAISAHSENYERSLPDIVNIIHEKLIGSVGCQLMLMEIDKVNKIAHYLGVGNIRGFTIKSQNFSLLLTKDGTVGRKIPTLKVESIDLFQPTIIILHSDGISRSWSWDAKKINIMQYGLNNIISEIMSSYRKLNDDASVIGVKNY